MHPRAIARLRRNQIPRLEKPLKVGLDGARFEQLVAEH